MDWIRVTKSGRDMTGLRGRLIDVTEEELKKHNTRTDCWTCIRGNTDRSIYKDTSVMSRMSPLTQLCYKPIMADAIFSHKMT